MAASTTNAPKSPKSAPERKSAESRFGPAEAIRKSTSGGAQRCLYRPDRKCSV